MTLKPVNNINMTMACIPAESRNLAVLIVTYNTILMYINVTESTKGGLIAFLNFFKLVITWCVKPIDAKLFSGIEPC